mmetsp:Transcript_7882/g.13715  ORF Transcript_7882/g.13715 Transcript_7882/m.13715 type:complete len:112 (-) Transcript_7882:50-385(-)
MSKKIYKILSKQDWNDLKKQDEIKGAGIDLTDGFIHFSTKEQTPGTLERFFADRDDLLLLAFEEKTFGDTLKYEESHGKSFPHVYGTFKPSDVVWEREIKLENGKHIVKWD